MKVSEDQLPFIQLVEAAAPSNPAAGLRRLYAKADGYIYYRDSAGTEKQVVPGADLSALQIAVQQDTLKSAVAGGTADAITATLTPAPTLTDMMRIYVRASGANTITNPTLNVNGNGAIPITKAGGNALTVGDIAGAGHELQLAYRASVPRWELLNPAVIGGGGGGGGAGNFYYAEVVGTTTYSSATIPYDNTIPQISEGVQMSGLGISGITPQDAASKYELLLTLSGVSSSSNITHTFAMFKDSDANAIAAGLHAPTAFQYPLSFVLRKIITPGSTTPFSISVRCGGNASTTVRINNDGTVNLGGVMSSSLTAREILP